MRWNTFLKVYTNLISISWIDPSYSNIIDQLLQYKSDNNIHPPTSSDYSENWDDPNYIRYQHTVLVLRDLLTDVITLKTTLPESFDREGNVWYKVNRNHLNRDNKKSDDPNDMTLPINRWHWENEDRETTIRQLIKVRFRGQKSAPQWYVDQIGSKIFPDQRILEDLWKGYLENVEDIQNKGVEFFIRDRLTDDKGRNYFLERYYRNIPQGSLESAIKRTLAWGIRNGLPRPNLPPFLQYLLSSSYQSPQSSLNNWLGL